MPRSGRPIIAASLTYSLWYGWPVSMLAARYSCSSRISCARACGSVSDDSFNNRSASFLTCAERPSAPPITKALWRCSSFANSTVVMSLPRSSSAMSRAPFGTARRVSSFTAIDGRAVLAHPVLHVVGQRLDLPRRVAARDDHALEHRRHAGGVVHDDVAALDVFQR